MAIFIVDKILAITVVPDDPDEDAGNNRVKVLQSDKLKETFTIDEHASVSVQRSHAERQRLLLLDSTIVLERHFLVIDAVVQHEPVGHQDIEACDEEVIDWLET